MEGANRRDYSKDYREGEDVGVQSYEEEADDAAVGDPFEEDAEAEADAKEVAVRVPSAEEGHEFWVPLASALLHSDGWSKRPFLPPDRERVSRLRHRQNSRQDHKAYQQTAVVGLV
jgi:hypothetical protein